MNLDFLGFVLSNDCDAALKLFDALIKPILLYGCQILSPHTTTVTNLGKNGILCTNDSYFNFIYNDIYEKFHLKFLKWSCGTHKKTSNLATWGDTGRIPLILDAVKLSVDYFDRAEQAQDETLISKAFVEQKRLELDWFKNISSIRNHFGDGTHSRKSLNVFKNMKTQFIDN